MVRPQCIMSGKRSIHEMAFCGDIRSLTKTLEEGHQEVNARDDYGQTALHRAAMNGSLACVSLLVAKGCHVNTGDVTGCTALHYAASNGYCEVARFLVEKAHANRSHKSNKGHTPRYMAKSRGQLQMVAFFNEVENKMDGSTWF